MKNRQYFLTFLMLLLLLTSGGIDILAMNVEFSTEPLSDIEIDTFQKNVNITMFQDEPPKRAIECFDVNENGIIAIGCSDFENKKICIYSDDGVFQYGFGFEYSGNFGVALDKDIINIYFVRSDIAVAVSLMGEVESIYKISNTSENNTYWNNCVFATKRKIGETEYILKNDMGVFNVFASSYSQLIKTNQIGEEKIIYDVNSIALTNMVIAFVGVIVFVSLAISFVILQFNRLKRSS